MERATKSSKNREIKGGDSMSTNTVKISMAHVQDVIVTSR